MANVTATIHRRSHWPRLSRRALLTSIPSAALGVLFWTIERDWHSGAWAAISLWIVLGLMAQVHDLWRSSEESGTLTSEERWGWRFAIAWRLAIAGLMVAYFLVRLLVTWKILALEDGPDITWVPFRQMCDAVLLTAMIIAIASSPRLAPRARGRPWSWLVRLLAWIAAGVFCVDLLRDHLLVPALVHMTISGIQAAWPPKFAPDSLATYGPAHVAWFFRITTLGVVAVVVSCGLLRLVSLWWRRSWRQRVCLGVLFATSLAITILLAGRIALAEVPSMTPLLAAQIHMPPPHRLAAGAILALLLVSAAAYRWSEPLPADSANGSGSWRRDEKRYYHERRLTVLLLAGVALTSLFMGLEDLFSLCRVWLGYLGIGDWLNMIVCYLGSPVGGLSLALVVLAVQSVFSRRCPEATPMDRPRLAIGLFSLIWMALVIIVVAAVSILAAWGFALGINPM